MNQAPVFMTPEQVADRLGDAFTASWVRSTARRTGFHEVGPRRATILSEENFRDLVAFIKNPPRKISRWEAEAGEVDHFAETERMPDSQRHP